MLIKGMKMPKNCDDCFLSEWSICNERFYCPFDDCPLVEIPAPHGDLIDRDALEREMLNGIKAGNLEEGYEMHVNINTVDDCVECVRWADAAIEAEEGEDE